MSKRHVNFPAAGLLSSDHEVSGVVGVSDRIEDLRDENCDDPHRDLDSLKLSNSGNGATARHLTAKLIPRFKTCLPSNSR
jgi:hypothetical protein